MTRKNGILLCSSVCAAKLAATSADLPSKSAPKQATLNTSSQLRNSSSQSSSRTQSPLTVMPGQQVTSGQLLTSNGQLGGDYIGSSQILGNRPGPQERLKT